MTDIVSHMHYLKSHVESLYGKQLLSLKHFETEKTFKGDSSNFDFRWITRIRELTELQIQRIRPAE